MRSGFAKDKGLSGLAGVEENWLIDTEYNKLRITGKNSGHPFSIDVQVSTVQGWTDIFCPDLFVVIRDAYSNRVWASKYVTSHAGATTCLGSSTIIFDPSFSPDENKLIKIEMYDDAVGTLDEAQNSTPIAVSPVFSVTSSSSYSAPSKDILDRIGGSGNGNIFGNLSSTLNKVLLIGGIGAGAYFLSPLFPEIRDGFENLSGKLKSKFS